MQDRTGIVWSEEETTLALYLYYLIESGQVDNRSKSIKDLATFLGRTPGSVEMKIGNLQFYDKKNSKGLKNGGKTDELIFNRYLLHPDDLDFNAKKIIDKNPIDSYLIDSIIKTNPYEARSSLEVKEDYTGINQTVVIKQRKDQDSFRNRLLANYDQKCCLSGVSTKQLLIASHIVPWSKDESKRLDPRNGLLLNAYLDRAFDQGIITVNPKDFTVLVSQKLKDDKALDYLSQFNGVKISLPKNEDVRPSKENLEYHNDIVFNNFDSLTNESYPSFKEYKTILVS